jgi:predicted transcriptional regulator
MKTNNIIDGKNKTINEDKQKRSSSQKPCLYVRLLKNKYFVLPSILFLLTLGTLIFVLIEINRNNNLKGNFRINQSFISEIGNQNNQMVEQLNNHLLQNNATIKQLNRSITELKKQNNQTIKQLNDHLLQNNATIERLNKTFIECKTERSEECHNILELGIEINHITLTILFSYQKRIHP